MEQRVLDLFKLCMEINKGKADIFLYLSPHVDIARIVSYEDGWQEEQEPSKAIDLYYKPQSWKTKRAIKNDFNKAEKYLNNLKEKM